MNTFWMRAKPHGTAKAGQGPCPPVSLKWSSRRGGSLSSRSTRLPWPHATEQSLPRVVTPPVKGRSCCHQHFGSAGGLCQSPSIAACVS